MQASIRSAFKRLQLTSTHTTSSTPSSLAYKCNLTQRSFATVVGDSSTSKRSSFSQILERDEQPSTSSTNNNNTNDNVAVTRRTNASPRNPFIVPAPVKRPPAPKISRRSSLIKGRSAPKVRKSLSPTELDEAGRALPSEQGQLKVFLPSVFMRLVRNTGPHAKDPYTATFRTDLRLTKPDISNYLKNVYGLNITSLRTINYLSKLKRNPIGGGYSRSGGTKNYKKVFVTMTEPFWYPEERSRSWLNEHFERDRMEEMRDRKMLKIGDGQKYGVSAPRYRGPHKSQEEIASLKAMIQKGGADDLDTPGDGTSANRLPTGLRMRKNVVRSRAGKKTEKVNAVQQEMERLRAEGW